MTTNLPTWDPAADPQAIPHAAEPRPLLATEPPPPEVWTPPAESHAAEPYDVVIVDSEGNPVPQNGRTGGPQAVENVRLSEQNGQVRRAPKIVEWIDVVGYPGYQARVWLNVPQRIVVAELNSGDDTRQTAALRQIVLEHNHWADSEGQEYPPADAEDFWQAVPWHLTASVLRSLREAAFSSPLAAPRRRS